MRSTTLLVFVLVSYAAGMSRSWSLPWIIAAILAATLLVSVTGPLLLVRGLRVSRRAPARASEGERVRLSVIVENPGRLPRFMIEVSDRLPFAAEGDETSLGMVAYIPAGGHGTLEVDVECQQRGAHVYGPVSLVSSFPLGLVESRRSSGEQARIVVYPKLFPVASLPLRGAASQIHRGGYVLPEGSGSAEFAGLREYRRGDSPRHIHWPTTARTGELMVREFEPLASAVVCLVLDRNVSANVGRGRAATFEYAVRIAASMARFATDRGLPFSLRGCGSVEADVRSGQGEVHFLRALDSLAVVSAAGAQAYAEVLGDAAAGLTRGETLVAFLSEGGEGASRSMQVLATILLQGIHVVAIVFDVDTFGPMRTGTSIGKDSSTDLLADLGAHVIRVRRGDNLASHFES